MKCTECKNEMKKELVQEKFRDHKLWIEEYVCTKCGDREIPLKEYQRAHKLAFPPLSKRIGLLLSYPAECLRKLAW